MTTPRLNFARHARRFRPEPAAPAASGAARVGPVTQPRLGFLGTGWIGRLRMQALSARGGARLVAFQDPAQNQAEQTLALVPGIRRVDSLDELLQLDLDGLVIATPSALHASQAIRALEHGLAVFCQKPLARTLTETEQVLAAARAADRLLAVDFSYRHLAGVRQLREAVRNGELGRVFALELVFHNAYGPDKPWFYDLDRSGGGCVMDLGIHLLDLAFWLLGPGRVQHLRSQLFHRGQRLKPEDRQVEDYALADFELGDAQVRLACSWNLSAGQDAVIEARIHGTEGGAAIRNLNGSFFDFMVERYQGTQRQVLAQPPDDWGGRALCAWVRQLARSNRFDPAVDGVAQVAALIDRIYQR